jgi:hypothetical protein
MLTGGRFDPRFYHQLTMMVAFCKDHQLIVFPTIGRWIGGIVPG